MFVTNRGRCRAGRRLDQDRVDQLPRPGTRRLLEHAPAQFGLIETTQQCDQVREPLLVIAEAAVAELVERSLGRAKNSLRVHQVVDREVVGFRPEDEEREARRLQRARIAMVTAQVEDRADAERMPSALWSATSSWSGCSQR